MWENEFSQGKAKREKKKKRNPILIFIPPIWAEISGISCKNIEVKWARCVHERQERGAIIKNAQHQVHRKFSCIENLAIFIDPQHRRRRRHNGKIFRNYRYNKWNCRISLQKLAFLFNLHVVLFSRCHIVIDGVAPIRCAAVKTNILSNWISSNHSLIQFSSSCHYNLFPCCYCVAFCVSRDKRNKWGREG